ncbi:MAG: DUF190 domain-containing protein [Gammaproteobacteria bacterium]
MATTMTIVRVYLTEADKLLQPVMRYLHDEVAVRGVTVFRAISGFGKSGAIHSAKLLEISLNLPLIVEFFDEPDKVTQILPRLRELVAVEDHIIAWQVQAV